MQTTRDAWAAATKTHANNNNNNQMGDSVDCVENATTLASGCLSVSRCLFLFLFASSSFSAPCMSHNNSCEKSRLRLLRALASCTSACVLYCSYAFACSAERILPSHVCMRWLQWNKYGKRVISPIDSMQIVDARATHYIEH